MVNEKTPVASPGAVIAATMWVVRTSWRALLALALVVGVPSLWVAAIPAVLGWEQGALGLRFWYLDLVGLVTGCAVSFAVVPIVVGARAGRTVGWLDALGDVGSRGASALAATLVYLAATVVGLILLVVPGLMFAVNAMFYGVILMLFPVSWGRSLQLSFDFVRGRWWRFFGHAVLMTAAMFVTMVVPREVPWVEAVMALPDAIIGALVGVYTTCMFLLSGGEAESLDAGMAPLRAPNSGVAAAPSIDPLRGTS